MCRLMQRIGRADSEMKNSGITLSAIPGGSAVLWDPSYGPKLSFPAAPTLALILTSRQPGEDPNRHCRAGTQAAGNLMRSILLPGNEGAHPWNGEVYEPVLGSR
jgi:hypothetical protein